MKNDHFVTAGILIEVLRAGDLLDIVKAIDQARADNESAVRNALVSHVTMHKRSELTGLSLRLLPNVGMGPESFLQWLAFSEFGRCVRALVNRPRVSFDTYHLTRVYKWGKNREVSGVPGSDPDTEMQLKRIACGVLLNQIEIHGMQPQCFWYVFGDDDPVANEFRMGMLRDFADGVMSADSFFTSGDPAFGDHASYYDFLVKVGNLIHSNKEGTP